jgi:hypothetical protein
MSFPSLLLFAWALLPATGDEVSFEDLLGALVDLLWLATEPPENERCIQFSSFDPASRAGRAAEAAWYANGDRGHFLRSEERQGRTEWVMVDVDGPGAIVRIWSANPSGELRFYVDGAEEPALAIPFQDLCDGKHPPFLEPLAGVRSRGWNCYVPIPFAKHLKLTSTTNDFYYHVNVRLFAAGTSVPSFTPALLETPALARTASALREGPAFGEDSKGVNLEPGKSHEKALMGPATIEVLAVKPEAADLRGALRSIRFRATFDGEARPAIDAPLGDFFATAPDFTPFATYPIGVTAEGVGFCRFPMPFERSARLEFVNEGTKPARISVAIQEKRGAAAPLRFHAKWRQWRDFPTRPFRDLVVLDASGPGRFVGCAFSIRNPVRIWWGEGDEHVWVDGEDFPSTFGTGTEDYFGYAWGSPELFQNAFHAQSRCDGPGNRGYSSLARFHLGDSIPFRNRLRFEIEMWHWADCLVDVATVAYWYAAAGAADAMEPLPPAAERLARDVPPVASLYPDAIEGELVLAQARVTGGKIEVQDMAGFGQGWSRDEHLWWTEGGPGDKLTIPFSIEAAGTYSLRAQFTRAVDYGIVQVEVDEMPVGGATDLYNDGVVGTGEMDLGAVSLSAGSHALRITILSANPKAVPSFMVGLDYFRLVRL